MLKKKLKPHYGKSGIILTVVALVLVAVDLITKFFEEKCGWHTEGIPYFLKIEAGIRNPGCAFSFLNEHPEIGQPILITFTSVLLVLLVFGLLFLPERFLVLKTSVSIVIAGAIGNLVDRLMFGYVRDWFGLWMFGGKFDYVYCNIADFLIVIGAIIAVVDLLFLDEFAVFPLTEKAKKAQAARKAEEDKKHIAELDDKNDGNGTEK